MNTQTLVALASDQKIENVFRAFGYSIPVGNDGRRLWQTKFKSAIGQRMRSGESSIGAVQRACKISDKTAYEWRKGNSRKRSRPLKKANQSAPAFAEIKVQDDRPAAHSQPSQIVFKRTGCELILPASYSINDLVRLIRAFESRT